MFAVKCEAGQTMPQAKQFRATLERMPGNLGWTIVYLPFNVHATWGTRAQIRVRGEVNGFEFRTSAFPTKRGVHFLMVNKQMQKGARVRAGMSAKFRLEPDTEKRVVTEPKEMLSALKEDKALYAWYRKLNHSTRNEIAKQIAAGKQAATRKRRAERMAERLLLTMEAERELPPVIRRVMELDPKGYAGWQKMSVAMRRMELMGIFGYRNPESQRRRIEKALERARERAESD